jgi:hypothetical protein
LLIGEGQFPLARLIEWCGRILFLTAKLFTLTHYVTLTPLICLKGEPICG